MRSTTSLGSNGSPSDERLDHRLAGRRLTEHVREQDLGLVDAAQHAAAAREDLHHDDRVEALAGEDLLGAREIDVGGVAGEDARPTAAGAASRCAPSGPRV